MPNNSSARREKVKKKKDKKKKDSKKTDTPPLPKEDTAGMDSGTLSLSSAGRDKASKDSSSLSHSPSSKEQEDQELSLALDKMEEAIQKHDNGEAEEPDWENADWAWARLTLRVRHSISIPVEERSNLFRKLREEIRSANPLVSREELKSQTDFAMLRKSLEWWKSVRQGKKGFSLEEG